MVGIDIGSKIIKIVEIEKQGGFYNLVASGIVGYNGTPVEGMIDEKELAAIAQVVKKLHSEVRVGSRDVAISIPEPQVFTRTIRFPMLTDAEIASAVRWESEQYIPIPIKEAIVQHAVLQRNERANPPEVLVLLVAAPRVVVEKYTKVISLAGLNPVAVETELLALTRALAPVDKTVLLVDIGASSTDMAITTSGQLAFARSVPIAGEAFSRSVSQGLGITLVQAEEYKKTYGLIPSQLEGKVRASIDPVVRLVVDEIKKAINFYQTEEKGEAPAQIVVTGGSSAMPEIVADLSSLLGMEVVVANPFSKVRVDTETAQRLLPYSAFYSVAVGLGLKD